MRVLYITGFFNCLHTFFACHTISETWHSNHTPNLQNHTLILWFWLSFQSHKTLFEKHNTRFSVSHRNLTGINIMAKVFVCKCLILRCVCDILNTVLHFARDVRHFAFVCVQFLDLCKVLKKRGKVLKMCVSSWKNCNINIFKVYYIIIEI